MLTLTTEVTWGVFLKLNRSSCLCNGIAIYRFCKILLIFLKTVAYRVTGRIFPLKETTAVIKKKTVAIKACTLSSIMLDATMHILPSISQQKVAVSLGLLFFHVASCCHSKPKSNSAHVPCRPPYSGEGMTYRIRRSSFMV